jgi:hypothetical protein
MLFIVALLADHPGQCLHPLHQGLAQLFLHIQWESYGGNGGVFLKFLK